VARPIEPYIHSRPIANVIGFFIVYVIVIVLGFLLALAVEKLFKIVHLSWLNRLLGGMFGVVRGVVVGAVVVLVIMAFPTKWPPGVVARSRLAPYMVDAAHAMAAAAPHEVRTGFRRSYDKIREIWNESVKKRARRPPAEEI
jgi:membrane protein required for colicin V production